MVSIFFLFNFNYLTLTHTLKNDKVSQYDKWNTKEERQSWENAFAETYLSAILKVRLHLS